MDPTDIKRIKKILKTAQKVDQQGSGFSDVLGAIKQGFRLAGPQSKLGKALMRRLIKGMTATNFRGLIRGFLTGKGLTPSESIDRARKREFGRVRNGLGLKLPGQGLKLAGQGITFEEKKALRRIKGLVGRKVQSGAGLEDIIKSVTDLVNKMGVNIRPSIWNKVILPLIDNMFLKRLAPTKRKQIKKTLKLKGKGLVLAGGRRKNPWITFTNKLAKKHPNKSRKEILKMASPMWKRMKK